MVVSDFSSNWNPTSPKKAIKDDALNRAIFAKNIATLIKNYRSEESLVVGIYGSWGSGKSTVLNFVIEEVKNAEGAIISRFNPWNVSDQNQLISSFFKFFSDLLNRDDASGSLKNAANLAEGLSIISAPAAFFGMGFVSKAFENGAKMFREISDDLANFEYIKNEISRMLSESGKRFIIVMDDIDRLNVFEIRQIFQLVKSMADFSNVVYVLAFEQGRMVTLARKCTPSGNEKLHPQA